MRQIRSKPLLRDPKSKKPKEPKLDDAEDYLAAAGEHEDAMGKHRGGDAAKSMRFARRALDVYSQGVARFPLSFDLAYNRARLELEIATHPVLVKVLEMPVLELLRQSLDSHEHALGLDPENADALFNTAQVLTAIAENIAEDDDSPDLEALQCLEKALEYQSRCFDIQGRDFAQSRLELEGVLGAASEDANMTTDQTASTSTSSDEEERWASIVEPVTADTLFDTVVAQVATLTTLCSIINSGLSDPGAAPTPGISLAWVESYSTNLLTDVWPTLLESHRETLQPRLSEMELAKVVFLSAFLEVAFRTGTMSGQTFKNELQNVFRTALAQDSAEFLVAQARALISFNSALADAQSTDDHNTYPAMRWTSLIEAQKYLATSSKLPGVTADNHALATTHELRGDISLLLHALSYPPIAYEQATKGNSTEQLLKNAEVYYGNATKLFGTLGSESGDERDVCEMKGTVVNIVQHFSTQAKGSQGSSTCDANKIPRVNEAYVREALSGVIKSKGHRWVTAHFNDLVDEGLVRSWILGTN